MKFRERQPCHVAQQRTKCQTVASTIQTACPVVDTGTRFTGIARRDGSCYQSTGSRIGVDRSRKLSRCTVGITVHVDSDCGTRDAGNLGRGIVSRDNDLNTVTSRPWCSSLNRNSTKAATIPVCEGNRAAGVGYPVRLNVPHRPEAGTVISCRRSIRRIRSVQLRIHRSRIRSIPTVFLNRVIQVVVCV